MAPTPAVETLTPTEQVVLLAVVDCHRTEETPIQTHELRHRCTDRLERVETSVVGTLTEADVMRSLYRLEDEGLLEEIETDSASPTGKGRPAYALAVDADAVVDAADDELLDGDADADHETA
ncbi:hypothetical protein [Natronolimnohabitans innermongolicus]|uniref:Transcriptional regulator n=1 Tax=Natronolimnohabitans innermongolicus JCM 12255 TaxID=1227499 RepID=L9XAL8_9EURY|nr:hypothetical protein [Natronolimnohabitans innermongolicus]ELY58765.1 hypothetical protein C493_06342 [Natronolimnohabitans innermongolicus JCM 12255]